MEGSNQAGEGRVGAIVGIALFLAVAWAAWNVAPVYFANYSFSDKMNEIARLPRRTPEARVMELLMKEASVQRLNPYLTQRGCAIETQATYRKIRCEYEREVEILPGWKHVFQFNNLADQPLI